MPQRRIVATKLSRLFSIFSHPHRIQIVETLRRGECDVNGLMEVLDVPHSRVSQHLAQLRESGIVSTRRDGRHVYYGLLCPELADWVREGVTFTEVEDDEPEALIEFKQSWSRSGSMHEKTDSMLQPCE
jgi:DNA-binding transcriptional ArsR family regulator